MSDINGLRFWMVADEGQWHLNQDVAYDRASRRLMLQQSTSTIEVTSAFFADAIGLLDQVPAALDGFTTRAAWDGLTGTVYATGALPGTVTLYSPPDGEVPTDLAFGHDEILYIALAGDVVLFDPRERWEPTRVHLDGVSAWRVAPAPSGGVWILDRDNRQLARLTGQPLPDVIRPGEDNTRPRPCEPNRNAPAIGVIATGLFPDEVLAGIACCSTGELALLTWLTTPEPQGAHLYIFNERRADFSAPLTLKRARFPYSMAWLDEARVAVLVATATDAPLREALVYDTVNLDASEQTSGVIDPLGDFYPLHEHNGTPFLKGVLLPPHYATPSGTSPLHPLALPAFPERGIATATHPMDSGNPRTVWHRLYIEATIPAGCGVRLFLAATETLAPPDFAEDEADNPFSEWHEHRLGQGFLRQDRDIPVAAWLPAPCEVPTHPGLLGCPPVSGQVGLFTVLIQRPRRRVRSLQGQYLHLRVELVGDGRATPEIAGVRAYGSRFSYAQNYLPELYREDLFAPDADDVGPATPADFLERFLGNAEGFLTEWEERIAHSYLLTDPTATPEEALAWLGSWIGVAFEGAYPPDRRRDLLRNAPRLFARRGTVYGLKLALDIATNGGVSGGEIVVVEDFRLRRTFATILGADLADEDDPLTLGLANSGNSFVGDTLFLGDERRKEFLALFDADLPTTRAEEAQIQALFERLANRVTVLVHQEVTPQNRGLIRRIVELETPAHVAARVVTAREPFLVGVASLVGVDTYINRESTRDPIRVGRSLLGTREFLLRPPSLDPRLVG